MLAQLLLYTLIPAFENVLIVNDFLKIGLLEQSKQAESISQYEANDKSLAQEIRETSQKVKRTFNLYSNDLSVLGPGK